MRLALMTEPQQGLSYAEISTIARLAESEGFEAYFRSDHYGSFPGADDGPTTDAWTTLAGIALETSRIGLGTLVSPVTFRHPGAFAKQVATVDEMSGGRVEVGVGIGWNHGEHERHGIRFPPQAERFEMLEEELEIFHGFWREPDGWSFEGKHFQVEGALVRPKPVQAAHRHPPIIVGGGGKPRSIRAAARWADEYNVSGPELPEIPAIHERFRAACADEGRADGSVGFSAMTGVVVGANDAEVDERIGRMLEAFGVAGTDAGSWVASRRNRYLIGTPDAVLERMRAYAAAGVERLFLQDWLPRDLDMITLIAREVLPQA